jgi:hypothetical protein
MPRPRLSTPNQTKVGKRNLYSDDLINHVFTEKPKPGQAYLRIPGDSEDVMVADYRHPLRAGTRMPMR